LDFDYRLSVRVAAPVGESIVYRDPVEDEEDRAAVEPSAEETVKEEEGGVELGLYQWDDHVH
jgi:hypothetical protein